MAVLKCPCLTFRNNIFKFQFLIVLVSSHVLLYGFPTFNLIGLLPYDTHSNPHIEINCMSVYAEQQLVFINKLYLFSQYCSLIKETDLDMILPCFLSLFEYLDTMISYVRYNYLSITQDCGRTWQIKLSISFTTASKLSYKPSIHFEDLYSLVINVRDH